MTTYHASWAETADRASSDRADAYREEVQAQGREPRYRDLEMRIVAAFSEIARHLQIEAGDSLVLPGVRPGMLTVSRPACRKATTRWTWPRSAGW